MSLVGGYKAEGYKQLVSEYGEGRVADAILKRWMNDPDAEVAWDRLADAIIDAKPGKARPQPRLQNSTLPRAA